MNSRVDASIFPFVAKKQWVCKLCPTGFRNSVSQVWHPRKIGTSGKLAPQENWYPRKIGIPVPNILGFLHPPREFDIP